MSAATNTPPTPIKILIAERSEHIPTSPEYVQWVVGSIRAIAMAPANTAMPRMVATTFATLMS